MLLKIVLVFVSLGLCMSCRTPVGQTNNLSAAIDERSPSSDFDQRVVAIREYLKSIEMKHGGIEVGVIIDGKISILDGFGKKGFYSNVEALSTSDLVHTASLTKQLTGWAIAQLVSEKKINLDDSISKFVEIKGEARSITIRDLIGHMDGLVSPDAIIETMSETPKFMNPDQILEIITSQKKREKLTVGKYGNAGYVLLSEVIKKASGMAYDEYMQEKVLKPAGMNYSHFAKDCSTSSRNVVNSINVDSMLKPFEYRYSSCILGAMGLVSNAIDLSNWLLFLNRQSEVHSSVYSLFSSKISKVRIGNSDVAYSMGSFIENIPTKDEKLNKDKRGEQFSWLSGNVGGFEHVLFNYPSRGFGVVVLGTYSGIDVTRIGRSIFEYLIGEDKSKLNYDEQFCEKDKSEKLSGFYGALHVPFNFELISDGTCLWFSEPSGSSPVRFDRKSGLYLVQGPSGLYFSETASLDFNRKHNLLYLSNQFELQRAYEVPEARFSYAHLIGEYLAENGKKLSIISRDGKLFLRALDSREYMIITVGDELLRTTNSSIGSLKLKFSATGGVVGVTVLGGYYGDQFLKRIGLSQSKNLFTESDAFVEKHQKILKEKGRDVDVEDLVYEEFGITGLSAKKTVLKLFEFNDYISDQKNPDLRRFGRFMIVKTLGAQSVFSFSPEQIKRYYMIKDSFYEKFRKEDLRSFNDFEAPVFAFDALSGDDEMPDMNRFIKVAASGWFVAMPKRQMMIAKAVLLWSPASAHRIASRLAAKGNKSAQRFIKEYFEK
jgi:CubicO group peptidase (beta-lactamase class C family)